MPIAMLRNRLAHHLTSWSLWHGLLALLAILLGSQLQVIVELGAGLPAHWQAALRMLATPLQLIGSVVLALALLAWATGQWPTARDLALRHGLGRQELLLLAAVFVVTHVLFWMLAWGTSTEGQAAALFREMGLGQGTGQDLAILFSAVILAPVCEEILFRGIMLRAVHDHVQRRGYRHLAVVLALVVSAVAFAMPHLGDSLVGRLALAYLATGLAFGLVYLWTGSLTAAMVSHALQSCYAFGSVLLFGRGESEVSILAYVLVLGCPVWVYLCARALQRVWPAGQAQQA